MAKRERKGFKPTIASTEDPDKLEALARQLRQEKQPEEQTPPPKPPAEDKPQTVRITIDIPKPFHAELKRATKMTGQTLKGYLLYLARRDMEERKERGEL